MISIWPLKGKIQHYAWGGKQFIPELLGLQNTDGAPYAELWMGAHPKDPSTVKVAEAWHDLPDLIEDQPVAILGFRTAHAFANQLPYLFKILDVQSMLSIQAHPTKSEAEKGFARENDAGIPIDAAHRNYKDDNHKPEVMVALTEFWLLHGFKSRNAIAKTLDEMPELAPLSSHLSDGISNLYRYVMEMPQEEVDTMLQPLYTRLSKQSDLSKGQADYWAAKAFEEYTRDGHYDRGIFSIYLFNLVHLQAGEGIFQDAGIPHAYLEGVNVELMANSDNVFRGGLTPKHVDVPELMQHLVFDAVTPNVLSGTALSEAEVAYSTPASDFELRRIQLKPGQQFPCQPAEGPRIFIVAEGWVVTGTGQRFVRGQSFFIPDYGQGFLSGECVLFRAGVPV
ncbi:MAG: mannose-6-phosphate isomerase [Saprospiraceae bacterium]|nr:MAG: mannose-6-phosphate isomerase [Saprospiraceae bacterium]